MSGSPPRNLPLPPSRQTACASPCAALLVLDGRIRDLEARPPREDAGDEAHLEDVRWTCPKCGQLLGCYDPPRDQLRVRYKDTYIWVDLRGSARVTRPCGRCGELARWPA